MQYRQLVACLIFGITLFPYICSGSGIESLYLSSLTTRCTLHKQWFGLVPAFPEAVFLKCENVSFVVTNPKNLIGHVNIRSREQALEYVRFFSSAKSYRFFDLGSAVEILPGEVNRDSDFNVLDTKIFKKHFKDAEVQEISNNYQGSSQKKEFSVTRTVIFLDQTICEITELVREDGFYDISTKKVLKVDPINLGIVHVGDI